MQRILGKFYYYVRAVDHTMFCALGKLTTHQTAGTAIKQVADKIVWFLNYAAIHLSAKIRYHASGIVFRVDSDIAYPSVQNERSFEYGHLFLSDAFGNPTKPPDKPPKSNELLYAVSSILRHIIPSAAEAEYAGLFFNGQETAVVRNILGELVHEQPPKWICIDNSTIERLTKNIETTKFGYTFSLEQG